MNLAVGEAGAQHNGAYFIGLREGRPLAQADDGEARRRLREISLELTGLSASARPD